MKKVIIAAGLVAIIAVAITGAILYNRIFSNNVNVSGDKAVYLYIQTGDGFADVLRSLSGNGLLKDTASFHWVALRKNYPRHVYPGRYRIPPGCNNNRLVEGEVYPCRLMRQLLERAGDTQCYVDHRGGDRKFIVGALDFVVDISPIQHYKYGGVAIGGRDDIVAPVLTAVGQPHTDHLVTPARRVGLHQDLADP